MAASEAYPIDPDATQQIVDKDLILPLGEIKAYSIDDDGYVRSIVDDDLYMVDGTFLDSASDAVENKLSLLNDIICNGHA